MMVTISVQTYNRSAVLARTLESLRSLRCTEATEYEILVVDNNSDDDTPEVIGRYAEVLTPRLRSVFEPRQGLSHARNRALAEARGQIVSFIDDDVEVDPGWLVAVCAAFEKYSATVVGGRSFLIYPEGVERPDWLSECHEDMYSRLDYGSEPLVNTDKTLFGLNFSVLRDAALAAGGFACGLGRRGKDLMCGEEKALLDRIRSDGGVAVYEPLAVVGHVVPAERLRRRWVLRRMYYGGVSAERLWLVTGTKSKSIWWLFIHMLRCCGSVGKAMLARGVSTQEFFERQGYAAHNVGRFVERVGHLLGTRRFS